ncbi:MAG: hypothetical protein KDG58_11010, partial [Anaerolineae bacterium]|nr:hypothetical protein [Anaerolineae bacterium]
MTILTPKGYSPARQPESEKPQAVPATPPPAEEAAAPQPQAGRGQVQLHFPPQVIGVNCPNCNTPFPAQLFT